MEPNIVVTAGWRLTAPLCVVLTAGLDDNLQEQAQLGQAQHFAGAGEKPLPSVSAHFPAWACACGQQVCYWRWSCAETVRVALVADDGQVVFFTVSAPSGATTPPSAPA